MHLRNIFALIAVFCLSACNLPSIPGDTALRKAEFTFNEEVFDKGGRALVILEAYNNVPARVQMNNYFVFKNDQTGKPYNSFQIAIDNKSGFNYVMLVPGTYRLTNYNLYGFQRSGNYTATASIDYKARYEASFTVNPGDVVYLGKIENRTHLGKKTSGFFGPEKRQAASQVVVVDNYAKLPPNYISLIESYTGKTIETKLLNWTDTAIRENKIGAE